MARPKTESPRGALIFFPSRYCPLIQTISWMSESKIFPVPRRCPSSMGSPEDVLMTLKNQGRPEAIRLNFLSRYSSTKEEGESMFMLVTKICFVPLCRISAMSRVMYLSEEVPLIFSSSRKASTFFW